MELGLGLPNGGARVDAAELVRTTVGAEGIGLDAVWVVDRWLRPLATVAMPGVPVPVEMPAEHYAEVLDPIDLLSHLAARTARIRLGTSAVNVLLHPPVLLARRFATLDRLSGGRVLAGVAAGWMAEEFAVAGVAAGGSGERFDDHLAAMRAVWADDPVRHDGPHYPIPPSDIGPKPLRGPLPLLVGYNTRAGLERAARIGDGLHPYRNDLARLADELRTWRDAARRAGLDPARMPVVLRAAADPDSPRGEAFTGPVPAWADDVAAAAELGVGHVLLQFPPGADPARVLGAMAELRAAVPAGNAG
ncbi:TIGR03619 family F420-dependent LLM class oxidoreductase [Pseudonocardia humida]|uniref:TIGR03619 family F420-dependent LLM class oxidoreductase n=1 Tax=Pseudonocardia humida TaxID=2800819 RepID=A0ABT1A6B9_9PSEU|nr:TIGR03619 family F420-dependent LLM class oxidoreductase [Pseudonocardia humida]MCO1658526.1 TIGR03619 family F420-dependent LLM class oxidoreductase [Pseudonocardia humida]